jgi:flagellar hook-length control protein FliK
MLKPVVSDVLPINIQIDVAPPDALPAEDKAQFGALLQIQLKETTPDVASDVALHVPDLDEDGSEDHVPDEAAAVNACNILLNIIVPVGPAPQAAVQPVLQVSTEQPELTATASAVTTEAAKPQPALIPATTPNAALAVSPAPGPAPMVRAFAPVEPSAVHQMKELPLPNADNTKAETPTTNARATSTSAQGEEATPGKGDQSSQQQGERALANIVLKAVKPAAPVNEAAAVPFAEIKSLPTSTVLAPVQTMPTASINLPVPATVDATAPAPLDMRAPDRWVGELVEQVGTLDDDQIRFQLSPEHLGQMEVSLSRGDDAVAIELRADSREAQSIIASSLPRLEQELKAKMRVSVEAQLAAHSGSAEQGQRQGNSYARRPFQPFDPFTNEPSTHHRPIGLFA